MNKVAINVKRRLAVPLNYAKLLGVTLLLQRAEEEAVKSLNRIHLGDSKHLGFLEAVTRAARTTHFLDFHKFSASEGLKIKEDCLNTLFLLNEEFQKEVQRFTNEFKVSRAKVYTTELVISQLNYLNYYFTAHFAGKVKRQPPLTSLRTSRSLVESRKLIPRKSPNRQFDSTQKQISLQ